MQQISRVGLFVLLNAVLLLVAIGLYFTGTVLAEAFVDYYQSFSIRIPKLSQYLFYLLPYWLELGLLIALAANSALRFGHKKTAFIGPLLWVLLVAVLLYLPAMLNGLVV